MADVNDFSADWVHRIWAAYIFCDYSYRAFSSKPLPVDGQYSTISHEYTANFTNDQLHPSNALRATVSEPVHFHGIFESAKRKEIFMAFMGTATPTDVVTDLKAWTNRLDAAAQGGGTGGVHKGFYERANSVPLATVVERLKSGWKVVLCGHSLGGAVAQLVTSRLLNHHLVTRNEAEQLWLENESLLCITFGAPLWSTDEFGGALGSRGRHCRNMFYNIVNHRDPVPRLQPSDITCSLLEDIANFVQDVNRVFGNQLADRVISLLKTAVVTSQSMLIKKYSHAGVFYFIQAPAGHMPASVKRFYAPSTGTNDDLDADVLFRHYMFHKHGYDNDSLRSNLLPYLQDHALSAYRSALQHIVGIVPDATRGGAELQTANFSPLSPDLWQPAIAQQNEAHQVTYKIKQTSNEMRIDLCLKGARLDYADSLYLGPVGDTLVPLWKAEISSQNADELQAVVVDKGSGLLHALEHRKCVAVLVTSKLGAGASTANPLSTITNVVMCESNAVPQEWQPTSRSVEDVFSDAAYLMNRYSGNTEFIARVIRTLAFEQTPDSAISMLKKMYPVVKSAAETVPDENVQTAMCKFWAELCRIPVVQKYFFQRESKYAEVYQLIKSAMRFKDNVVLNITALEALMDVTTIGPEAVTCFYDMKMQNTVKEAIQHHLGKPGHEKYIHTYGVNIFANMALVKSTALGLSRAGVFDTVMKVMRAYPDELEVQRAACRALDKFVVNEEEIASGFRSLLRNDLRVLVCNAIVLGLREAPDDRINRYASNVYALLNNDIDIIETTPGYCRVQ